MEYRDGDPRTPVSAENLNRTEKKLKVLSASVDDMTTTMTEIDQRLSQSETKINTAIQRITEANPGVDQETLKRLIKDELAALPPGEKPEATDVDRLIDEKLQAAVAKLPAAQPVGEAEISKAVTQYMAEHPVPAAPVPQVTLVSDAGAAYVTDSRFGEITGGDITANLQAAINDPQVKVIKIPSGEFQIKHVNVDKLAGKRLEGAGRDVTKLAFDKTATNVPFLATSGGKLTRATFHGFTLDMGWQKGDTIRHGIQLSNAPFITFDGLRILNSGGAGILLQSLGKKADADSTGGVFDDIQMDGIGLSDRTTDHGIRLVGNAGNASIRNLDFRNIKGGMGVGGVDDADLKKGPSNITIESSFIRMAEGTTGFEPIGFTKGCSDIIVRSNHLWSFDNGTSLSGARCKFDNNIVYQAWNFGVSLGADDADFEATVGSTVTNNTFMDVALQNETRDAAKPVEYAIVRLAKPRRCVISGNTYIGRPKLPAYFVKIVGNNFGFNDITGNAVSKSDFSRVPVNNTVATDKVQEFLDDQTPAAAAVTPGQPQQ